MATPFLFEILKISCHTRIYRRESLHCEAYIRADKIQTWEMPYYGKWRKDCLPLRKHTPYPVHSIRLPESNTVQDERSELPRKVPGIR